MGWRDLATMTALPEEEEAVERASIQNELLNYRKELAKTKPEHLTVGDKALIAIDRGTAFYPDNVRLEVLSYLLVLFRQLKATVLQNKGRPEAETLAEVIYMKLGPALRPGGSVAEILMSSLESTDRTTQIRAGDILAAACRLADSLPLPPNSGSDHQSIIVPLFRFIAANGVTTRPSLMAVNVLLEHVPDSVVPNNLLDNLLSDLEVTESANVRCSIIANLLSRRRTKSPDSNNAANDNYMLEPVISFVKSTLGAPHLVNFSRYLLPSLFKLQPSSAKVLLRILDSSAVSSYEMTNGTERSSHDSKSTFSLWILVASLAVSLDVIDLYELPQMAIQDAILHQEPENRLRAFQLLVASKDLLSTETMDLLIQSLSWNSVLPASGSRSDLGSAAHSLFIRMKVIGQRENKQPQNSLDAQSDDQADGPLRILDRFRQWFLDDFVDSGLRKARRPPVAQVILALILLETYMNVFGGDSQVQKAIFTEHRVSSLFACQASEFTEVRSRARTIIESATIPLPDYGQLSSRNAQTLLASALGCLGHSRKPQAEAGKSSLCIIFKRFVLAIDDHTQSASIAFLSGLIDRLESHLRALERDLAEGIEAHSLHGLLAAVREVIGCAPLSSEATLEAWNPTFHRLLDCIHRVWGLTSRVISLAPSDVGRGDNGTAKSGHEITRAYEVLGGVDDGEEDDDSLDPTNLLSGCWRATTEASNLLAAVFAVPILQYRSAHAGWTEEEVDHAGRFFLLLLHEVRHRGTFTKIAIAFAQLVESVKDLDSLSELPKTWLGHELRAVNDDSVSITRRSAALPYSMLSIVSGNRVLLDYAFDRLIDFARVNNEKTSDDTKVHSFNILKVVIFDTRQARYFDRYFERAVMTALQALESPNWNVRNVGLHLFSTFLYKSIAVDRAPQDFYRSRATLATRHTFHTWHIRFPSILPFLTDYFSHVGTSTSTSVADAKQLSLFPILIIIRSLRWSEQGKQLQDSLLPVVMPYLGSAEWQVREVATQAVSSLLSPIQAIDRAVTAPEICATGCNLQHGQLLLLRALITYTIDWQATTKEAHDQIEKSLLDILQKFGSACRSPTIAKAVLDCIDGYCGITEPRSPQLLQAAFDFAKNSLTQRRDSSRPGRALLLQASTAFIVKHSPTTRCLINLLGPSADELQHVDTLKYLPTAGTLNIKVFKVVLALTRFQCSLAVQTEALQTIVHSTWHDSIWTTVKREHREEVCKRLSGIAKRTKCIPLKEAAINALGWAIAWTLKYPKAVVGNSDTSLLGRFAGFFCQASHEDESLPMRLSAMHGLTHLSPYIFPVTGIDGIKTLELLNLHQALLRLLQDDDEEIRLLAGNMVVRGLCTARPVVHAKAVEIWWEFVEKHIIETGRPIEWIDWLWQLCLDTEGFESDLLNINGAEANGSAILFGVEPSNLFRDSLDDCQQAANILSRSGPAASHHHDAVTSLHRRAEAALNGLRFISPIDDAWTARETILRRIEHQRTAIFL